MLNFSGKEKNMKILEEFKSTSFLNDDYIKYLKNSDLPLVLHGAAILAENIKRFLSKNGIKIDFVTIDKEYYKPNTRFYDFEVLPLEDILTNNSKVNIILAFIGENNEEKIKQLNKIPNVEKCMFFDINDINKYYTQEYFYDDRLYNIPSKTFEDNDNINIEVFKKFVNYVELEVFSYCNRKCVFCANSYIDRHSQNIFMPAQTYSKIIDELATVDFCEDIYYCRYSEPLADRIILDRLREAREKLPNARLTIITNGDFLTSMYLDELADAGLNCLIISKYPSVYKEYSIEQEKQMLIEVADKLNLKYKDCTDSKPVLLQLVHPQLNIRVSSRVNTEAFANNRAGSVDMSKLQEKCNEPYIRNIPCSHPFRSVYIAYNGSVTPCCPIRDDIPEHKDLIMGNANDESLFDIFTNAKYSLLRYMVRDYGKQKIFPCSVCDDNCRNTIFENLQFSAENILYLKTKVLDNSDLPTDLYGAHVFAGYKYPLFVRTNTSDLLVYKMVIEEQQYNFTTSEEPKVIIDAGGNIGLTAVYFAEKYPKAKIITIEPEEDNFKILKKNTQHYSNITAINAALWDSEGEIELLDVGLDNWGFMTATGGIDTKYTQITTSKTEMKHLVKAVTIEKILRDYNIDMIDILKIDIEGAEKEVFNGHSAWIKNVRSIITELHERMKKGCEEAFFKIVKEFDEMSYQSEDIYLSKDGFVKFKETAKINLRKKIISIVDILKNSKLPTYLYGVGEMAQEFYSRLIIPNGINISGALISKEYYKEDLVFFTHSVKPLEDILNENLEANVVICFLKDNYDDVIENLKKIAPNCNFLIPQKLFLEELLYKINALNHYVKGECSL